MRQLLFFDRVVRGVGVLTQGTYALRVPRRPPDGVGGNRGVEEERRAVQGRDLDLRLVAVLDVYKRRYARQVVPTAASPGLTVATSVRACSVPGAMTWASASATGTPTSNASAPRQLCWSAHANHGPAA